MKRCIKPQHVIGLVLAALVAAQSLLVSLTDDKSMHRICRSVSKPHNLSPILVDLYGDHQLNPSELSAYIANKNIYLSLSDSKNLELNFDDEANLPETPGEAPDEGMVEDDDLDLFGVLQIHPKSFKIWFSDSRGIIESNQETYNTLLPYLFSSFELPSVSSKSKPPTDKQFCDGACDASPDFALVKRVCVPTFSPHLTTGTESQTNYFPSPSCTHLRPRAPPFLLS